MYRVSFLLADVWRGRSVQIVPMRLILVRMIVFSWTIVVRGLVVVLMMTSVCNGRTVAVVRMMRVVGVLCVHRSYVCRSLGDHLNRLGIDVNLRVN